MPSNAPLPIHLSRPPAPGPAPGPVPPAPGHRSRAPGLPRFEKVSSEYQGVHNASSRIGGLPASSQACATYALLIHTGRAVGTFSISVFEQRLSRSWGCVPGSAGITARGGAEVGGAAPGPWPRAPDGPAPWFPSPPAPGPPGLIAPRPLSRGCAWAHCAPKKSCASFFILSSYTPPHPRAMLSASITSLRSTAFAAVRASVHPILP